MSNHFQHVNKGPFQNLVVSDYATVDIGQEVTLGAFASVMVTPGAHLSIGHRVFFNDHCSIRCTDRITIGNSTMFGDGVRLFDCNHKYSNYHVEDMRFDKAPITIGDNCWIGANTVILKGVTIGSNTIIGANSLIYKDIPANSIVQSREELIIKERPQQAHHVFTYTLSDTLEQLEYLVTHLPEVAFHIAAPTTVSPYLESFERHVNVNLYTATTSPLVINQLLDRMAIYLDINHWGEAGNIIEQVQAKGKPILAFDNVTHRQDGTTEIYDHQTPQQMVDRIKALLGIG